MPPAPRKLVVFSGAGLSADSGVPTYRDAGGLWEGNGFRTLATLSTRRRNAPRAHRFSNDRRVKLGAVEPNPAHRMLVDWRRRFGAALWSPAPPSTTRRSGSCCTAPRPGWRRGSTTRCRG